jgi:hypothetical protein
MMASDEFFRDFGSPIYVEDGTMFGTNLSGGGWGDPWPDSGGGGWGDPWPGSGGSGSSGSGVTFGFTMPVRPPASGSSGPDVKRILTDLANSTEAQMRQTLGAWQQGQISADAAIEKQWALLNGMVQQMMRYGSQGMLSAAERDRRIDPSRLRWDWIAYYIDPISVATTGQPAPLKPLPQVTAPVYGGFGGPGGFGGSTMFWMVLILLGFVVIAKMGKS